VIDPSSGVHGRPAPFLSGASRGQLTEATTCF
jgi:hypothetical protein